YVFALQVLCQPGNGAGKAKKRARRRPVCRRVDRGVQRQGTAGATCASLHAVAVDGAGGAVGAGGGGRAEGSRQDVERVPVEGGGAPARGAAGGSGGSGERGQGGRRAPPELRWPWRGGAARGGRGGRGGPKVAARKSSRCLLKTAGCSIIGAWPQRSMKWSTAC